MSDEQEQEGGESAKTNSARRVIRCTMGYAAKETVQAPLNQEECA